MSLALELLGNLAESYLVKPELEPHIVIDTERKIHVPHELKRIAVERDHNIETVTFDCPRYWDGKDLSKMYIYVNYVRADKTKGQFLCKNVRIDDADENIMHFDWILEEHATLTKGKLRFLVCAQKTGSDGKLVNHWNSELNEEMHISEGLECEDFAYNMQPAIITDLLTRMDNILLATNPLVLDKTLNTPGLAAEAKATGDRFAYLDSKQNWINVLDYGCKCDGVTDDTEAFKLAINASNNSVTSTGQYKRVIYIPSNMVITSKVIIPHSEIAIIGNKDTNSIIKFVGSTAGIVIGTSEKTIYQIGLKDICFIGDGSNTEILKFYNCVNIFIDNFHVCQGASDSYMLTFEKAGLVFMNNCTIEGGSNTSSDPTRHGIFVKSIGSIFNISNCNVWNLNNFITFDEKVNLVNVHSNWIECVKDFIRFNCNTENMSTAHINIRDNVISAHAENGIMSENFSFIQFNSSSTTNLWESNISVTGNTIYLWDMTSLRNDSLIYIPEMISGSSVYITFTDNVFSGKRLWQLEDYIIKIPSSNMANDITIVDCTISNDKDCDYICNHSKSIVTFINQHQYLTAPNGIYLTANASNNSGNIYYANGAFYAGYNGTIKAIPHKTDTTIDVFDNVPSLSLEDVAYKVNSIIYALQGSDVIS